MCYMKCLEYNLKAVCTLQYEMLLQSKRVLLCVINPNKWGFYIVKYMLLIYSFLGKNYVSIILITNKSAPVYFLLI